MGAILRDVGHYPPILGSKGESEIDWKRYAPLVEINPRGIMLGSLLGYLPLEEDDGEPVWLVQVAPGITRVGWGPFIKETELGSVGVVTAQPGTVTQQMAPFQETTEVGKADEFILNASQVLVNVMRAAFVAQQNLRHLFHADQVYSACRIDLVFYDGKQRVSRPLFFVLPQGDATRLGMVESVIRYRDLGYAHLMRKNFEDTQAHLSSYMNGLKARTIRHGPVVVE